MLLGEVWRRVIELSTGFIKIKDGVVELFELSLFSTKASILFTQMLHNMFILYR